MLMPFGEIVNKYNIKPTGILHIGASHGEEFEAYTAAGIERMIWIEAIPEVFEKLRAKLAPFPMAVPINACISDQEGKQVDFHITNNAGQSSSMLGLNLHREVHPDVHVVKTIQCITETMDGIISRKGFDLTYYDFLNIDLQGAELLALKGMKDHLHKIKYAYIEVNEKELYTGCPLIADIDAYMQTFGFYRADIKMTDCGWGDALYKKIHNIKSQTR